MSPGEPTSWSELLTRAQTLFAELEAFVAEIGGAANDGLDKIKSGVESAIKTCSQKGWLKTIERFLHYIPGVGLVFAGYHYWSEGSKEEWKAALIRQGNGCLAFGVLVGSLFVPLTGWAFFASSAGAGALGALLGTGFEKVAADKFIQDAGLRETLAKDKKDLLYSAVIGGVCGVLGAALHGLCYGKVCTYDFGSAILKYIASGVRNVPPVIDASTRSFLFAKGLIISGEIELANYRVRHGMKSKKTTEELRPIFAKADKSYSELQDMKRELGMT